MVGTPFLGKCDDPRLQWTRAKYLGATPYSVTLCLNSANTGSEAGTFPVSDHRAVK